MLEKDQLKLECNQMKVENHLLQEAVARLKQGGPATVASPTTTPTKEKDPDLPEKSNPMAIPGGSMNKKEVLQALEQLAMSPPGSSVDTGPFSPTVVNSGSLSVRRRNKFATYANSK